MIKKCLFLVSLTGILIHSAIGQQPDTAGLRKEKQLAEVVIKSKKPLVEFLSDKLVLNVANDITATGGTVLEILQRAPGVSVLNEETISMAGKTGVNILIDGRPVYLSGRDLANYLRSLPGSSVDKIEIILNPSSKYDAQGNAGVINIRLKKPMVKGLNGSINTVYTQSNHYRINGSGNLNYRQNKWNFYMNAGAAKAKQHTDGRIVRYVTDNGVSKLFENRTTDQDGSTSSNYQLGIDYYLNEKNTIGVIIKGSDYRNPMLTPGTTLISSYGELDSSLATLNDNKGTNARYSYNINHKYEDTLGTTINADVDYTFFDNSTKGDVTTDFFNKQNSLYRSAGSRQNVNTGIHIYSIKLDYTRSLRTANTKLEAGLKWTAIDTDNDLRAFILQNGITAADTGRTNLFNYDETLSAGYISLNKHTGKWEYQAGLRVEHSRIKGASTDLKNNRIFYPDTAYFNIFPTVFVQFIPGNNHRLSFSYSRRINRPTYQDLNPFEYIYDYYTRERGNPYLLPEFSHVVELGWSWNNILSLTSGFSYTSKFIQSISRQQGDITSESEYNVGYALRYYSTISITLPVNKWWSNYINLSPFYKQYRGSIPEGKLENDTWGMSWYTNQLFSLPQKWKLQLSSWGNIATRDALYRTAWLGSIDAGVSKPLLNDKLNIRLSLIDVFNTQRWYQQVQFGNVHFTYNRKWESRGVRIQLSWKLGKTNFKLRDRSLGAEDAINRIKE